MELEVNLLWIYILTHKKVKILYMNQQEAELHVCKRNMLLIRYGLDVLIIKPMRCINFSNLFLE